MFDPSQRIEFEGIFNFDAFHQYMEQFIKDSASGATFVLKELLLDRADFWLDYAPGRIKSLILILENELYDAYELIPDNKEIYHVVKSAPIAPTPTRSLTIRDLAKECLEQSAYPLEIGTIFKYVNEHGGNCASIRSLYVSLGALTDIFVRFSNGTWGLKSVTYKTQESLLFETSLSDKTFELRYSTKREHKPTAFFNTALSNSSHLDLGLGYFSSAVFNVLASGFAHFIKNGGIMRMYINPNLSEEDYELLKNHDIDAFKNRLLESYDQLFSILSKRNELFFKCLSYLIRQKRIEIRIVVLNEGGIAHEKFGVFTDSYGDEVAFNGSMNLTAAGLTRNIESIDCICSWHNNENKKRIEGYHHDFNNIWNGRNKDVTIVESDEFCNMIVTKYPQENVDALIKEEAEVIAELKTEERNNLLKEPHFPPKFPGAFPYQVDAYKAWCKNGKKGIFAMATGTGKTITSLNCALEEYMDDGFYRLVILVPSLALVEQWADEATSFHFGNIIMVSSENALWRTKLMDVVGRIERGKDVNYTIITTYQSFVGVDFQQILPRISSGAILIADEAHNIGSESVRNAFRNLKIDRRIALSATPQRVYDEEGTKEIESFFNDTYPYTYSFSMRKAIKMERLMPYYYHPRIAYLEEDEMQKYTFYTRQLLQLYNDKTGRFSDPERAHTLLMQRKNILHKARNKMMVFNGILNSIGEDKLKYCFVYSAAGKRSSWQEADDENIDNEIISQMLAITKETFPRIRCNTYTSKDSKVSRRQKLEAFAAGQLDILFAKNCLDEGVDVPRAEYGIFTSSTGNPRQFIQRRGRLIRRHKDKRFAYIYDIVVSPNFWSPNYDRKCWNMEKNLVEGEMRRVANFASLASNYYTGAMSALQELLDFYEISLDSLVLNEED